MADSFDTVYLSQPETLSHPIEDFEDEINYLVTLDPSIDTDVHNLPTDSGDIFTLLRSETPTRGPFTVSSNSESAYDYDAASSYTYNTPSQYSTSNYIASPSSQYIANPALVEIDLAMKDLGIRPDGANVFVDPMATPGIELGASPLGNFSPTPFNTRTALSEYEPSPIQVHVPSSSLSDYYPAHVPPVRQNTVSPANVSPAPIQGPTPVPSPQMNTTPLSLEGSASAEAERRFPCPSCPRSFTRRYNLKTHIATHDVNRLKPFVCEKKSCGRSFSRKNDLKRHMKSIHRPDTPTSSVHSVGVGVNPRSRCEKCGRSWVGKDTEGCDCDDVK
ncbi:hypothetical protein BXZ70DRAFT_143100 [Cristinia sonorae]|uniref:C2H2-type domain-containing protein n=1 Tax=Cristinia sonorae TaxID=1940300 RepID=A0A8K0UPB3_9AGAR|nr:hypothetical protein BXZ70DRAFT_143100 [Cristinia sonorae]